MISEKTFEIEWIKSVSQGLGRRGDPKMLEKVIYALYLLEQLRTNGLSLIFKGLCPAIHKRVELACKCSFSEYKKLGDVRAPKFFMPLLNAAQ